MTAGVAVAVSGGRDSMALLHCLGRAALGADVPVWALHVHHGLMPQADEWAAFVERICRRWATQGLPLRFAMQRLTDRPAKGQSIEAWARAGRYAGLASMAHEAGCTVVALAHHRGDQAETVLLQALRGAGAAGLAAMPARVERDGITWLRPWLEQPRQAIEAYASAHRIRFVDDASNADPRFARSRLRLQVMPALRAAFPDAETALADAARQAGHARALIDEVARADLPALQEGDALRLAPWLALSPARRRASLRAWLTARSGTGVAETLLDRLCDELPAATAPARWPFASGELRRYRGRLSVADASTSAPAAGWPCAANVAAAGAHAVPGTAATLQVSADGAGLPLALLQGATWRARAGAERFQRAPGTAARSLKKQFQAAGVPAWSRDAPLLYAADGTLLFVPGLGIDARAAAAPGQPRMGLRWLPGR